MIHNSIKYPKQATFMLHRKKRKPQAIIFDSDGVLNNSFPDQFTWFKYIARYLDVPFPYETLHQFREVYREPVYPDLYTFLGFNWDKDQSVIWEEYVKHKRKADISLFPGIEAVITTMALRVPLAIASSNTHEAIRKPMDGLDQVFDVIIGKEDIETKDGVLMKPHPYGIVQAIKRLEERRGRMYCVMYVGDQISDIIAARRVSDFHPTEVETIAVTYGYGLENELTPFKADHTFHQPVELLRLLEHIKIHTN